MKTITLTQKRVGDLKVGDVVARSCGQITALEFLPINEIRFTDRGTVHFIQKSKNGCTMSVDDFVWVLTFSKRVDS